MAERGEDEHLEGLDNSGDDRDSLCVLPLSTIPIETRGLRRARLIKNVRLQSVVEMFSGEGTGSGQLDIQNLGKMFGWPEDNSHPDLHMLARLSLLHSYDVYSLRITLRDMGIPVNTLEDLKLSDDKSAELTGYMKQFTRPLIIQIYGDSDIEVQDFDEILNLFKNPDRQKALEGLHHMSRRLEIEVMDVPKFLEDYGDIFLSLSYYRQCLDSMEPIIGSFLMSMNDLRNNWQLRNDPNVMKTADMVENTLNNLMAQITGRFENFDRSTSSMWENLSAKRFRQVETLIESYHTTIGGVLCALWVKMNAYQQMFPKKDSGGPIKRSEFLMTEMKQGLDNIKKIEDAAPMLSELD